MLEKLIFTGDSVLKGRNGYTSLGYVDSHACPDLPTFQGATRYIEFHSKRSRGSVGTALLELNREDFQRFKEWIAQLQFEDIWSAREKEIGSVAFAGEQSIT